MSPTRAPDDTVHWAGTRLQHVATLPRPVVPRAALGAVYRVLPLFAPDEETGCGGRQGDAALRAVPRAPRVTILY